jgi:hypothetical protein
MQTIVDFMGDESVWKTMVPGVVIQRRPPSRHVSKYPTAYFVKDHWTCRKADETDVFDPYNHYQEKETHGFCQTFAMMYLLDQLPEPTGNYKSYNKAAIEFIYTVIKILPINHPTFICHDPKSVMFRSIRAATDGQDYSHVAECGSDSGDESLKKDCHLHFCR